MSPSNDNVLEVLKEIRDILSRIYTCFEDEYVEIQRRKIGGKLEAFETVLTPDRREIYPLLFDTRQLSQREIADEVNVSQPTVSRFISALVDQELIDQIEHEGGSITYRDKYDLVTIFRIRTGGRQ